MPQLQDKVAIVTGATSGIGNAAARLFAREGAKIVVSGRREHALATLAAQIEADGGTVVAVAGDIRDEAHAQACVAAARRQFGGLDIAFNNAGGTGAMADAGELSVEDWRETLDTNLTSAFLAMRHQVPAMRERGGGSLIFTGSFVGSTAGFPGLAAYGAAKAGLSGLVQVLAVELGSEAIRVNVLPPGAVDTPGNHANMPDAAPGTKAFVAGLHALKRLGRPDELARAALFLASDASTFVTGTTLLVDGGVSINRT